MLLTKVIRRYSLLEKTCCALAWAARRLRQYMLTHTTLLISKMDPIKYIFEKPALSGRPVLSNEYGIGPGIVIIKGATFGTNVIITGLLVETLEELLEMVTMETSL